MMKKIKKNLKDISIYKQKYSKPKLIVLTGGGNVKSNYLAKDDFDESIMKTLDYFQQTVSTKVFFHR